MAGFRLLVLACLALSASPLCSRAEPVDFHLPAQPVADALRSFSEQAQVRVHFRAEELQGIQTSGLTWRLEPVDALNLMLHGTGLVVQTTDSGEFLVTSATAAISGDSVRLAPLVVEAEAAPAKHVDPMSSMRTAAIGNLDLHRAVDDALPYSVYDREQITRSGAADLNGFLQRALLDGDPTASSSELSGTLSEFGAGSTNLNLRGYGASETVILVNGRRLPEVVSSGLDTAPPPPDVSVIPLSLVERIEVLPVSSSALYAGNAVGGVINIILRPVIEGSATELTTTFTNGLSGVDAPQMTTSLLHAQSSFGGALRLRVNASVTDATPATEADLGHHQRYKSAAPPNNAPLFRATPNVRSANSTPLSGAGSSIVTSVAPGADGTGGLAAFTGRDGVRNLDFFDGPGDTSSSHDSIDFAYGREQRREIFYGSAVCDLTSWLQLGVEATHAQTTVHRGYGLLRADLELRRDSPFNPLGQDVRVSLNEGAPNLGADYSEGRIGYFSGVFGLIAKAPTRWRFALDVQYARNTTRYRGLVGADLERWQQLVDSGAYNPLRDTQVFGPPAEFYDRVLIYRGARDSFVTVGAYQTLDVAMRATRDSLRLPTGAAVVNVGLDFRRNELATYRDALRYGDGSLAGEPLVWFGRALQRYSVFGEIQAPPVPERWLPRGIRATEADLAVRFIAADSARESNVAPTFGLKLDLVAGFSLRGSVATSNRFPTPSMSRRLLFTSPRVPGSVIDHVPVFDPVPDEHYSVDVIEGVNPDLRPEQALTQTAGILWQHGKGHAFRASLDFADTRKTGELVFLDAQTVLNLEAAFPERVRRAERATAQGQAASRVTAVVTGPVNMAWRHSQNWNAAFDYAWTNCLGGRLELATRVLAFTRFDQQVLSTSPAVDQLRSPNGAAPGVLRYRANFGGNWSRRGTGAGIDGYYYAARALPAVEWRGQGDDQIDPHWQFDACVFSDLSRWLPWRDSRFGLRGQLRVNNLLATEFPRYVNATTGAGVQPYGDWRGRVYSLSLTASY